MCSLCSPCECTSVPRCAVSLRAPLRIEMKGVCNESHSARVPDPAAIRRLRGENHRDRKREGRESRVRDGGKRRLKGKHRAFFFPFFPPPTPFGVWLPSCDNVKLAFLLVCGEQCGTATRSGRGERFGAWGCQWEERWRRRMTSKTWFLLENLNACFMEMMIKTGSAAP